MDTAIIIGRFQPFHNGHVSLIESVQKLGVENLIIGVGSSKNENDDRYKFTFNEVYSHINKSIIQNTTNNKSYFKIVEIPDINNPEKYADHVSALTGHTKNDSFIVSNNISTLNCFDEWCKFCTNSENNFNMSGTKIRKMIKEQNFEWEKLVPKEVAAQIK